ncbi:Transcription factor bHLH25 [Glycine soja]|uniref:Transcription factor bHLH25 n=2 Tax=Glycine soja TaxID=3848 RepID=A0A0B2QRV8_GLYSO|nr:Transcription factor bHLH25 [Glycine soja]RZB62308.1 Transcription factor bHLH25 [Glycine soja]
MDDWLSDQDMGGDNSFFSEEHRNPTLYCVANETRNQLRRSKDTDTGSHYVREKKETANGRDIHSAFSYYTWLEQVGQGLLGAGEDRMEQSYSWENWALDKEMGEDEEEFLRDILSKPAFSSESESQAPVVSCSAKSKRAPMTYILSFDNSTITPAPSSPPTLEAQPGKRAKRASHIMAERKRRQQLTQSFIALSATIPGLNKKDKSSMLGKAIDYVKQLQERVTELEQRKKRGKESMIILKKSEANSEDCCRANKMLPDVEARVTENEVLIEIHCEKEDGLELIKILDHLENLHLCVTASSVLPFRNSTLSITIIAQMGDAYKMKVNDLVKKLRQVLLNHTNVNTNPY